MKRKNNRRAILKRLAKMEGDGVIIAGPTRSDRNRKAKSPKVFIKDPFKQAWYEIEAALNPRSQKTQRINLKVVGVVHCSCGKSHLI